MLRITLLALAVLALAGSASSINQFDQQGTVATPRAPLDDGQPVAGRARLQVFAGTTTSSPIGEAGRARVDVRDGGDSAAAVTRRRAGATARIRGRGPVDLQLEVERSWSPGETTAAGTPIDAPDDGVMAATAGLRISGRIDEHVRLGVAIDAGGVSVPIRRSDRDEVARATTFLGRVALVPSARYGDVTVFGVAGASTVSQVPASVVWESQDGDPGVQANAGGGALVLAGGATVDVGGGARITARVGDAFSSKVQAGHYGPQVDVGLAFDLAP